MYQLQKNDFYINHSIFSLPHSVLFKSYDIYRNVHLEIYHKISVQNRGESLYLHVKHQP